MKLVKSTEVQFKDYDLIIVGSGLYGSTIAERVNKFHNKKILIVEARSHIAGNIFTERDSSSRIDVHKYGSHIFHTSNQEVWDYVNEFVDFNTYQHRVLTEFQDQVYSMPINLGTINRIYQKNWSPSEAYQAVQKEIAKFKDLDPKNLEDQAIKLVGPKFYEAFIKGYTLKQWEKDPKELPASIIKRLPVRFNYNDRYFSDTYEGIPIQGYTAIVEGMLKNSHVMLDTDFFEIRDQLPSETPLVYTGPIDRFFDFSKGKLEWRTLDFEWEKLEIEDHQGTSVLNYADIENRFTRCHEFKHFQTHRSDKVNETIICREFSRSAKAGDEVYYPVNTDDNRKRFEAYWAMAQSLENVYFGGRLGRYTYLDMHQVISAALSAYKQTIAPLFS